MKDQETKERFIELRAKGLSFEKIAKELKVSKQTLINWSKELEIEIANLKAIELDALQEKYFLTKQAKIELFGEQLQKVKMELEKRDLSKICTDKLFDIFIKLNKHLREEAVEIMFRQLSQLGDIDFMPQMQELKTWQA